MNEGPKLTSLTLFVMVGMSLELNWTTTVLSTASCEGQDMLLIWNYTLENNEKVKQLQWFYNKTLICYHSESDGFIVQPPYKGTVERNGTTGILLKKVSSKNSGEYTLYPKLAREQTDNRQQIVLTVHKTPTHQCKADITIRSKNVRFCSTDSCGRSQLKPQWRLLEKPDPVGNESYLTINSSWNAEVVLCCPHGPSMKCLNGDQFSLCASTPVTVKNLEDGTYSVIIVLALAAVLIVILCILWCFRRKLIRLVTRCPNASRNEEHNIELQHMQTQLLRGVRMQVGTKNTT